MRVNENNENIEDLELCQEPKRTDEISHGTGIHLLTVHRIIHRDLQLKCVKWRRVQELSETNRVARLTRSKQLLKRYSDPAVDFIRFSDEKCLPLMIEPPLNSQNDGVYAPIGTKKRHIDPSSSSLLRTRLTFSRLFMVSKMGMTELIFVNLWGEGYEPVWQILGLKELMCE